MQIRFVLLVLVLALAPVTPAHTTVVEVGDLNIINDPGNPSDGLRFLDMTFSDGLSLVAALANAQGTYSNARLATPSEFDDLFAAAGISYDSTLTASDAFTIGGGIVISSGANYDTHTLRDQLGLTAAGDRTLIWSDPDGSTAVTSTRDRLLLRVDGAVIFQGFTPPQRRRRLAHRICRRPRTLHIAATWFWVGGTRVL